MKVFFQYYRYLLPHRNKLLQAFALLLASGAASGAGLPGAMQEVFEVLFESDIAYSSLEVLGFASLIPIFFT